MALAILQFQEMDRDPNQDKYRFLIELGSNNFYQYRIGAGDIGVMPTYRENRTRCKVM